jgi:hypothetical protein
MTLAHYIPLPSIPTEANVEYTEIEEKAEFSCSVLKSTKAIQPGEKLFTCKARITQGHL